jgi:UPF0755 protein
VTVLTAVLSLSVLAGCATNASASAGATGSSAASPSAAASAKGTTAKKTAAPTATPTPEPAAATVDVTIPEGYSLIQICRLLEDKGVAGFDELFASANGDDFSAYDCIAAAGSPANRCWPLEGYLYPDTYEFYLGDSPKRVWGRFLSNFDAHASAYADAAAALGMTLDEAVTLASLIEKESGNPNEVAKVSSVLHNRLEIGQKLELDASIVYVETYVKPYLSGDVNRFNAYYNTYKCAALPAGPISNPGSRALNAALHPASTDYLYFVNDAQNNYYFASTWEGHVENLIRIGLMTPTPVPSATPSATP